MRESFLAAYRCIDDVYRKKSFSGVGLNKILSGLSPSDKPLTAKLVYGVIDKSIFLTYIIRQYAKTVKPSVLPILQIGAYCLYFLSIPDAVAVNESVELAKAAGKGISLDLKKFPILQETIEICECYRLNPYQLRSEGCFLIVTDEESRVERLLAEQAIRGTVIGEIANNNDKIIQNGEDIRYIDRPAPDELVKIL